MHEFYDRQREEIDKRFVGYFYAAEQFARLVAPADDILIGELWSHFRSPALFAARHPDWFRDRWRMPSIDIDWYAQDVNPWHHLQDCLGVRGRLAILPWNSRPSEALGSISAIAPTLGSTDPDAIEMSLADFLRHESLELETSDLALVQLVDDWSDDIVLSVVPIGLVDQLAEQALVADIYKKGLRDLRTQELDHS
jgi:hypothetical protein